MLRTHEPDLRVRDILTCRFEVVNRFWPSTLYFVVLDVAGRHATDVDYNLAACIELLHMHTLVLDDVVDQHELRWGVPTPCALFGRDAATFVATRLFAIAVLEAAAIDPSGAAASTIAWGALEIAGGQLADLDLSSRDSVSLRDYLGVARAKTAIGVTAARLAVSRTSLPTSERRALEEALRLAGTMSQIANDFSELTGLRGFERPDTHAREASRELALGRKTIFHVFHDADDRVNDALRSASSREDVYALLRECGAVRFAHEQYESLRKGALGEASRLLAPSALISYIDRANPIWEPGAMP